MNNTVVSGKVGMKMDEALWIELEEILEGE